MTDVAPATATGYPFFQIAQRYGLDYADVLLATQQYDRVFKGEELQRWVNLPQAVIEEVRALLRLPVEARSRNDLA